MLFSIVHFVPVYSVKIQMDASLSRQFRNQNQDTSSSTSLRLWEEVSTSRSSFKGKQHVDDSASFGNLAGSFRRRFADDKDSFQSSTRCMSPTSETPRDSQLELSTLSNDDNEHDPVSQEILGANNRNLSVLSSSHGCLSDNLMESRFVDSMVAVLGSELTPLLLVVKTSIDPMLDRNVVNCTNLFSNLK